MGRRLRPLPILLLLLLAAPPAARAEPLVADLSNHLIAITTGFTGADVLLFGATDGPADIIAVVRGPTGRAIVRRKGRLFGIWVNKDATDFEEVPNFYAVASSRPLDQLLTPEMAQRYRVGLDNLGIRPAEEGAPPPEDAAMQAALIAIKKTEQLYRPAPGRVVFLGGQLFRADFHFPGQCADRDISDRGHARAQRQGGERPDDAAGRLQDRRRRRYLRIRPAPFRRLWRRRHPQRAHGRLVRPSCLPALMTLQIVTLERMSR